MPSSGHFAEPIELQALADIEAGLKRAKGMEAEFWGTFLQAIKDGCDVRDAVGAALGEWDL